MAKLPQLICITLKTSSFSGDFLVEMAYHSMNDKFSGAFNEHAQLGFFFLPLGPEVRVLILPNRSFLTTCIFDYLTTHMCIF